MVPNRLHPYVGLTRMHRSVGTFYSNFIVSFVVCIFRDWPRLQLVLLQLATLQSVSSAVSIFLQRVSLAIGIFCM